MLVAKRLAIHLMFDFISEPLRQREYIWNFISEPLCFIFFVSSFILGHFTYVPCRKKTNSFFPVEKWRVMTPYLATTHPSPQNLYVPNREARAHSVQVCPSCSDGHVASLSVPNIAFRLVSAYRSVWILRFYQGQQFAKFFKLSMMSCVSTPQQAAYFCL